MPFTIENLFSAWLKGTEDEVVQRVNNRLEHMTNLEMETAEELQIANYGIGGHYDPHFDFARKEETKAFSDLGTGNRIATVLFYVSNTPPPIAVYSKLISDDSTRNGWRYSIH